MSGTSITGEATEETLPAVVSGAHAAGKIRRRAGRGKGMPLWATAVLLVSAVYFLLPLYATAVFGFSTGKHFTLQPLWDGLADDGFHSSLILSLTYSIVTTIIALAVVAPTAYLVELRFPRLRTAIEFVTILPFVIPPIILAVGLSSMYGINSPVNLIASSWAPVLLIGGYFVLTLPFVFRAIDNALRAVDVKMLSEASASLGAGPMRTFLSVIVPSISLGLVSAALLAFTTAMGEFTLAALLGYPTFPVYLLNVNGYQPRMGEALVLVSFVITWAGVIALAAVARRTPGTQERSASAPWLSGPRPIVRGGGM
jgi:putative spermidine/putrescine transport system permease protein